jgi:hypothetical protein
MGNSNSLASLVLAKLDEQIERAQHLISLIPPDKLQWSPHPETLRVCDLLGHLLECLAGFCAIVYAVNADKLSHFAALRELPVNHCCEIDEARERLSEYALRIEEGFALLTDDDLARCVPTVFAAEGEPVMTLILGNFEHLMNHKYQLFFYLKLLGVGVNSADLYRFR